MRKLRDLIAELRPAALDDLGLGPAIESLAKRQAAIAGFAVEVDIGLDSERRLANDTETAIYRIVQEGLSNAVKHARAGHVALRVTQLSDRVQLVIEDDGDGFDPDGVRAGLRADRDARARAARRRPAVGPVGRRRPHVGHAPCCRCRGREHAVAGAYGHGGVSGEVLDDDHALG